MKHKRGTETSAFGVQGRVNHDSSKFYNTKLYSSVKTHKESVIQENTVDEKYLNTIFFASATHMSQLPDNSIHLMITSPPYNVSKEYDEDLSLDEYLHILTGAFEETYRVLVNGGRACINVANLGRKPYIPLSHHISNIMNNIGFNMRGEIIWNKASSASPSTAWGSWMSASNPILRDIHEYIVIFSKGDYKRTRNKGDKKEDTILRDEFIEYTKSIWTFNAESAKKVGHPAPFPIELPERLIKLYSFTGDIILDPFMGSGTTVVAALKNHRTYVGYETNQSYIDLSEKRINNLECV